MSIPPHQPAPIKRPKPQPHLRLSIWHRLVRFGFRLLYNELAWTYDPVSWLVSLGDWRAWQRAALPFVQGRDVLEIGHGPGHMLLALHQAGSRVTGLDLSPNMGRLARRRLAQSAATAPLVSGDAQRLPFAAAVFDTVLATFPTEYALSSETLNGVHRVLRPNGRFLIVPEAHLTGTTPTQRFIEWLYAITGQRSSAFAVDEETGSWPVDSAWLPIWQRFETAGFRLEVKVRQLARSGVTVLIATKEAGSTEERLVQSPSADEDG